MSKISYKKSNGHSSSYEVFEHNGVKISVDNSESILAEKYRPRIIDDLILPDNMINKIKNILKTKKIPNMLFYSALGGSGKDSIISVISNNVPMTMNTINASLDNKIETIRTKVAGFVRTNSLDGTRKVLYLNEAGGFSKDKIDSLKALIEDSSDRVSFMMTTNSTKNISHAFKSRFQFFDMNFLPNDERKPLAMKMYKRLTAILAYEKIEYEPQDLQRILIRYFPSYRELMVTLEQSIMNGKLVVVNDTAIDSLNEIIEYINKGDFENIVKISDKITVENILREFNNRKTTGLLNDVKNMPVVIQALNDFQNSLASGVIFPSISFSVFCLTLIQNKIILNSQA